MQTSRLQAQEVTVMGPAPDVATVCMPVSMITEVSGAFRSAVAE